LIKLLTKEAPQLPLKLKLDHEMSDIKISDDELPGLYQTANTASINEQKKYFYGIQWYLILLIIAALVAYFAQFYETAIIRLLSAVLFLSSLGIMIWLRYDKPDDIWYNGRAVAESVKTRAWRWMMRAEPYLNSEDIQSVRGQLLNDLKKMLDQNESLIGRLGISASIVEPITEKMIEVRKQELEDRFKIYRRERITDQELWYSKKAKENKNKASFWFKVTVILHSLAIFALLYNIMEPELTLPIEVIAVAATSVLTWFQAKKHNELASSYSLTLHEIVIIKSEVTDINNESEFSEYVMNCENAFSREHTQWYARKSN